MRTEKQTLSFRLGTDKVAALDTLAITMQRDRTFLLTEAVQSYLELQQWQLDQIAAGIAEANAGDVIEHSKLKAMTAKWRSKK